MEKEPAEDLKSLGIFGIFAEAFRIIISLKHIFIKITIFLIIPLSFIFLANTQISHVIFKDVHLGSMLKDDSPTKSTKEYSFFRSKFIGFCMFMAANNFLVLITSLLSTSAVVYTVACVYINTAADLTFGKVINVVPKLMGNRLLITFLFNYVMQVGYHAAYIVMTFILLWLQLTYKIISSPFLLVIIWVFVYMAVFTYVNVVWHLSCVVSILEEDQNLYGFKAMKKSKELLNGKFWVSTIIFIIVFNCTILIQVNSLKVSEKTTWVVLGKVMYCLLGLLTISLVILVGLVTQCVIYFVCKSYHDGTIDKVGLQNFLNVYLPDIDLEEQEYERSTFRKGQKVPM